MGVYLGVRGGSIGQEGQHSAGVIGGACQAGVLHVRALLCRIGRAGARVVNQRPRTEERKRE